MAYESGVAAIADPLGGSYFVEKLTAEVEQAANDYIRRIDDMGGMIPAIERGFPQSEIADASYEYQRAIENGERIIVGVNGFHESDDQPIELLQIDESAAGASRRKLAALRRRRDHGRRAASRWMRSQRAAEGTENTMPLHPGCGARLRHRWARSATRLRDVFGTYQETSVL